MPTTRSPAVAGLFYPADTCELRAAIHGFLGAAKRSDTVPKAVIAPHAGYIYSGPVAASAYARLAQARKTIRRVVLLGPSHRIGFYGLAASSADRFTTPLGPIPVDRAALEKVLALPQARMLDQVHELEHSLEVHLPFLQEVLGEFSLVPLVTGDATAQEVADVLELHWGGPETLIVISTDLSHYHDYETARRVDAATSRAIEALHPEDIDYDQACGRVPLLGLLEVARRHGRHIKTIDLRNSGDTAGPRDRVVGYGAYVLE